MVGALCPEHNTCWGGSSFLKYDKSHRFTVIIFFILFSRNHRNFKYRAVSDTILLFAL